MIPSAYIHALEYFVRAKEESATNPNSQSQLEESLSQSGPMLSTLYAYQLKYVVSLSKQLPESPSTLFPSPSRSVPISAPTIVKSRPTRQGPFLFQPAPQELGDGLGGSATDLVYINVEGVSPLHSEEDGTEERLGVLGVVFSDGKIDICLDVDKIEAMWETGWGVSKSILLWRIYLIRVYRSRLGTRLPMSCLWWPSTRPSTLVWHPGCHD